MPPNNDRRNIFIILNFSNNYELCSIYLFYYSQLEHSRASQFLLVMDANIANPKKQYPAVGNGSQNTENRYYVILSQEIK